MKTFSIPLPKEFDFEHCLTYLKRSPKELLHTCVGDEVFKLITINSEKVLFKIGCIDKSHLHITVLNKKINARTKLELEKYIREWFDLDQDILPFYKLAAKDKVLKPIVENFYGYRIVGQPDLFESLTWAVIGQQINLPFAYTMKQRLVENFGETLEFEKVTYYTFPKPEIIASLTHEQLLPLQFSRQKSKYAIGIAAAFVSGEISKDKIKDLSWDEALNELIKIKGVGQWTANYALLRTFRYPNAFPLGDAGINNAIKKILKLDRRPTTEEVVKYFRKYQGWEAYATLYLWKMI
jgi:DNA-3-methyladenine glycosylase II